MVIYLIDAYKAPTLSNTGKCMIFTGATLTDLIHRRNPRDRLESALARVVAAMTRLQRQRTLAQARYEMLDRAGSEILATIDALLKEPTQQDRRPDQTDGRRVKLVHQAHSETAGAT